MSSINSFAFAFNFITTLFILDFLCTSFINGNNTYCILFRFLILFINLFYTLILIPISFSSFRCCGRKSRKIRKFMRNSLCHIMNSLSYFLTIILFIESFLIDNKDFINSKKLYLKYDYTKALLSSVTLTIDLLINVRTKHEYSSQIICAISLFVIIYELIYGIQYYILSYKYFPFLYLVNL